MSTYVHVKSSDMSEKCKFSTISNKKNMMFNFGFIRCHSSHGLWCIEHSNGFLFVSLSTFLF